ncbi:protein kinase domain-containing protein [Candidatus Uabimicrobium amorphum]|uniref:Protein kinase n=1 Tax=Uabimicrobium amorphum TaxID=2596890 RepID=A0A5S9IRS4_UABAM|nr:protein kinase [Candidatus Uabimicrobium amorphum]BBM86261.1 protein kinase [Candidatus Uabimicrobium amorphum]
MDNDTFRSLWSKILEQDNSQKHSVRNTYKSKEMTFSHDITLFPQQQTFSGDNTIHSAPLSTDTFSEDSTVSFKDSAEKVTFSATETTAPQSRKRIQASFNTEQNYQNYQEINRGGMGIIYRAEQTKLKREIAIKKTLPQVEKNKFLAESLVTAYLDHPNIVPIYEIDENNSGDILLAMKLVKGVSWKDLLYPQTVEQKEKAQEYDLKKHLEILISVCNAVSYAHSKGIVHCDLKPDNVMIGDFGEVLVMDWGIAVDVKANADERRTFHSKEITTPMGTPCYMSPELAEGRGKDICFATDVYLLGAILYEILHKKPPFRENNLWLTLLAVKNGKTPTYNKNISSELKYICRKAMATKIENRYQSVSEFSSMLQEYSKYTESMNVTDKGIQIIESTIREIENVHKKVKTKEKDSLDMHSQHVRALKQRQYQFYENFSEAIFAFKRAIEIWGKNETAKTEICKARLEYACFAFANDDFALAASQTKKIVHLSGVRKTTFEQLKKNLLRKESFINRDCKVILVLVSIYVILFTDTEVTSNIITFCQKHDIVTASLIVAALVFSYKLKEHTFLLRLIFVCSFLIIGTLFLSISPHYGGTGFISIIFLIVVADKHLVPFIFKFIRLSYELLILYIFCRMMFCYPILSIILLISLNIIGISFRVIFGSLEEKNETVPQEKMFCAVEKGREQDLRHLGNLPIEARDRNGLTALMIAASYGELAIAKILIKQGAELDAVSIDSGETSLMLAIRSKNIEIAKLLIREGANINIEDHSGKTAFEMLDKDNNQILYLNTQ